MDGYSHWTQKYNELSFVGKDRADCDDEAHRTFPRYNVLNAILIEVERYRPEEFSSLDEAKRFFRLVAIEAQSIFTKPPNGNLQRMAMDEEREALSRFIDQLTEEDLSSVEPLFHRRVFSTEEAAYIWGKLSSRWGISDRYWYPLTLEKPDDTEAFQDAYFEKEVGAEKLQEILRSRGVKKVWEIRENGISYELELSVFEPCYDGAEGFWCDGNLDWIIYASHENSFTVGGWLLSEVQDVWSIWKERIWTTPFFD